MDGDNWDGAGALPFCLHEGEVYFLLQETLGGKKEGFLVDFGGGRNRKIDTSLLYCGAREFTEETAGLFTTETPEADATALQNFDCHGVESSPEVKREVPRCLKLVQASKKKGLVAVTDLQEASFYASFLIQLSHSDLVAQNAFFSRPTVKKVRKFHWVPHSVLVSLLKKQAVPGYLPLHERVFCLQNLDSLVDQCYNDQMAAFLSTNVTASAK